jgi:hypothetical protein
VLLNDFATLFGYCMTKLFVEMEFCIPVYLMGLQLLVPVAVQCVNTGRGPWLSFEASARFENVSRTD